MIAIAMLETSNFSFLAIGKDEDDANDALYEGVCVHVDKTDALDSASEIIDGYGVNMICHESGFAEASACWRDGSPIWKAE